MYCQSIIGNPSMLWEYYESTDYIETFMISNDCWMQQAGLGLLKITASPRYTWWQRFSPLLTPSYLLSRPFIAGAMVPIWMGTNGIVTRIITKDNMDDAQWCPYEWTWMEFQQGSSQRIIWMMHKPMERVSGKTAIKRTVDRIWKADKRERWWTDRRKVSKKR